MLMHIFSYFYNHCTILSNFSGFFSVILTEFCIIWFWKKLLFKLEDNPRYFFLNKAPIFELQKLKTANQCCTGVCVMTSDLTNPFSWEDGRRMTAEHALMELICLFPSPNLLTNEGSQDALWRTLLCSTFCCFQCSEKSRRSSEMVLNPQRLCVIFLKEAFLPASCSERALWPFPS